MLKKFVSIILIVGLLFCLSACDNQGDSNIPTENDQLQNPIEEVTNNDNTTTTSSIDQPANSQTSNNNPTHTHSYSNATCTSPQKCSCGATKGSALGHAYSGKTCSRCGANNPNYKEKHTHYYSSKVTKEATCATEGVKTYTCSCGHSYTEPIAKDTYHDWESATCTSPKKCNICGITEGEPKEHNYYSSGKCSRCGQMNPVVTATLSKCTLELPSLPQNISYYSYSNKLYSTVKVTNITYKFECDNDGKIELELYFSGEKTYDYQGSGQSSSCKIGWKLYGPNGSVIRSDTFYSPSIAVGETFTDKSEGALYSWDNGTAGKYRLEIVNVN